MTQIENALEVLNKLGQTRKIKEKRKLLSDNKDNNTLRSIFSWVENPRITFGVKKFNLLGPGSLESTDELFQDIEELLRKLSTRKLTGHAALSEILIISTRLSADMNTLLDRILSKNLKCNVGTSLIFEVWPDIFPRFGCQLAESAKTIKDIKLPCYVSPKLDGFRNITGLDNNEMKTWTRSGDLNYNTEYVKLELAKLVSELGLTFDGELMAENWNNTASVCRSSVNKPSDTVIKTLKYHIFDAVKTSEFESGNFTESFSDRYKRLCDIFKKHDFKFLTLVPHTLATTHKQIEDFYNECLTLGYEGIVAKDINAVYAQERNKSWKKYKPEETIDAIITDYTNGTGLIETIFLENTDTITEGLELISGGSVSRAYMSNLVSVVKDWDAETGGTYGFAAKLNERLALNGEVVLTPDGGVIKKYRGAGAIVTNKDGKRLDCSGINHAIKLLIPLFINELKGITLEMTGQEDFSGKESISNFARYKRLRTDN